MRDISFPLRGPGYLDIARAGALLPGAAKLWIAGFFEMYEGNHLLPNPQVIATRISLPSDFSFGSYESAIVHLASRSEEHTSELQSQSNLVCRLLLEKK